MTHLIPRGAVPGLAGPLSLNLIDIGNTTDLNLQLEAIPADQAAGTAVVVYDGPTTERQE
jgi:hypothetical protein